MSEPEWGDTVRYLTDDRDRQERYELVMFAGGNGDFYVATVPEGNHPVREAVRICTSGGAASRSPRLVGAIGDAYRALLGEPERGACFVCGRLPAPPTAPPEDGQPTWAEIRTALEKAMVRLELLKGRMAACDANEAEAGREQRHGVSEVEIPGWIDDLDVLLSRIPKEEG